VRLTSITVRRRRVSTTLHASISTTHFAATVCQHSPVVVVPLLSTPVPARRASTAPSAATSVPARASTWSTPAAATTNTVRRPSALDEVPTARCAGRASRATVPGLDSAGSGATGTWMSVPETRVCTEDGASTRQGRTRATAHVPDSPGHDVNWTLTNVASRSAIITVSANITTAAVETDRKWFFRSRP